MADTLETGAPAPEFTLPSQTSDTPVSLSDFRGKTVVLYFYPKDDTPGCTTEACAFSDRHDELQKAGAVVLGVSPDDVASHRAFAEKYKLPFPLLADTDHAVAMAYDVWREKNNYGKKYMGIVRSTFLIDGEGVIRRIWRSVKVDGHDEQVAEAIAEI